LKKNGLEGLYDQLMVELRNEDQASFKNFLRMPPSMFHELSARVGSRLTKEQSTFRKPFETGNYFTPFRIWKFIFFNEIWMESQWRGNVF